MDVAELEKVGLNKNEAIVYIELMKLGFASAGTLIKKTEFHRNIVYDNLEKLIDKGLISYILEGKLKIFQINPPEMLPSYLEKQQKILDEKKLIAKKIQKEAEQQFKSAENKQDSMIYRGVRGVKLVMNDVLETKKDFISFGGPKESNDIMQKHFWKNFTLKQIEAKISSRLLFNSSLREWGEEVSHRFNKIKYLSNAIEPLTQTIVFGSKTAIIVWKEKPIVTLIIDKTVAESYYEFFQLLWETANT